MRAALLTLFLLLSGAASEAVAAAPRLTLAAAPQGGTVLGEDTRVSGVLTRDGVPQPGQVVTLEGRRHPFDGPFRPLASGLTRADGGYRLAARLSRNHDLRVVAAAAGARTRTLRSYVFPRATLSVRTVRRNVVRITQVLRVPATARLAAPTRFYLGRAGARTAPFVAAATPRRLRAGVYRARASIRVPARYDGRFRYAACFRATPGAGLGDPEAGCPRFRFRL